jgi:hypothetical protein
MFALLPFFRPLCSFVPRPQHSTQHFSRMYEAQQVLSPEMVYKVSEALIIFLSIDELYAALSMLVLSFSVSSSAHVNRAAQHARSALGDIEYTAHKAALASAMSEQICAV